MITETIFRLLAATGKIDPNDIGLKNPIKDADAALSGILNTIYLWSGIVCVLVIIIAGAIFITSNDNPQKITRAKEAILGAVVGLVVIMIAFTITQFVIGSF